MFDVHRTCDTARFDRDTAATSVVCVLPYGGCSRALSVSNSIAKQLQKRSQPLQTDMLPRSLVLFVIAFYAFCVTNLLVRSPRHGIDTSPRDLRIEDSNVGKKHGCTSEVDEGRESVLLVSYLGKRWSGGVGHNRGRYGCS